VRWKRSLPILLVVLAVAAALVAVVQLRRRAPPEAARLLPGADAFFYVNLKWLRTLKAIGELPPVTHDPEYERFIQLTGFQFERDLDEAAFAIHYPHSRTVAGRPEEFRFSEVLVGKINRDRLSTYLHQLASVVEGYHATDIFNIPMEGRTVRVAVLSVDSVAVSNVDDPSVIRGMIDRSHKLASPFGGPALLRQYYKTLPVVSKTLPLLKLAWFIGRIDPAAASLGGWSMLLQKPVSLVVAAYYPLLAPGLHLRAEAFSETAADAQALTERVSTFLSLFHAAEMSVATKGTDPDVKALFDSLNVEQHGDRAILTASIPTGFLRKAVAEPQELAPPATAPPQSGATPAPQPSPPPPKQAK
jgi:hypothetical protein